MDGDVSSFARAAPIRSGSILLTGGLRACRATAKSRREPYAASATSSKFSNPETEEYFFSVASGEYFQKTAMSARSVARVGHRAFRQGRVIAIPGFSNSLFAFLVRLAPRLLVRKATKYLNLGGHV